ncbi:unnamed protein product [Parnassius apollo]|uniref:(apollo) hypothetical protein n=1 Tax=Parnassius apollo TaxID=110799 RepID=A0A8S3W3F9_PARAO|nr:unnamed protein product [Parnassius apollo]
MHSTKQNNQQDAESVSSIVIPQRKLFAQKDSQTVKNFEQIMDNRENLAQLYRSKINYDKTINVHKKDSFNRSAKECRKPVFPAKIANQGEARKLVGNRVGAKRKNIFTEFIVSESEDEIPVFKPKFFGSSKNNKHQQQKNSAPRKLREFSRSHDIIDKEIGGWKLYLQWLITNLVILKEALL